MSKRDQDVEANAPTVAQRAAAAAAIGSADTLASFDSGDGAAAADLRAVEREQYEILSEYARGGLGRIVRARDRRTGRIVAIKEMLGNAGVTAARFVREAIFTANLEHPAIVPVYEVGCWPGGEPFYAMKLVAGRSLRDRIDETGTRAERLALLPHVIDVAEALAYAHGKGIIHRDLKPANVLLGDYGETVVIDWGLAKHVAGEEAAQEASASAAGAGEEMTMFGAVLGTPGYMPPEQALGEVVNQTADVYAIGAMLYDLLSAVRPYAEASTVEELLDQVVKGPPRPLAEIDPDLPPDLVAVVERAMAHRAGDRYPSAGELAAELRRFQTGQLVRAHHYSPGAMVRRFVRRHRAAVTVAAAAALALAALGTVSVVGIARERDRALAAQREAERQRGRAEERLAALYIEQGKKELLAGRAGRALPLLAEALAAGHPTPVLSYLLGRATAPLAALEAVLPGHDGAVMTVAFLPEHRLLTAGADFEMKVWDLDTGKPLRSWPGGILAAVSPDGARAVSFDHSGEIQLWQLGSGKKVASTRLPPRASGDPEDPRGVVWSRSGDRVAAFGKHGGIAWWDARTLAPAGGARAPGPITAFALAPDGKTVAAVGPAGLAMVFEIPSGRLRARLLAGDRGAPGAAGGAGAAGAAPPDLRAVAYAPDGASLAFGDDAGTVFLLDLAASGEAAAVPARALPEPHAGPVLALDFSPDRRRLASASEDGTAALRDRATGARIALLRGHGGPLHGAAFSPDGARLATRAEDGTARLWDADSGAALHLLQGHTGALASLAFSGDGTELATGALDHDVRVWRPRERPELAPLIGHRERVRHANFSPDGERVASAGYDDTARVFDARSGAELALFSGHGGDLRWVDFSPDGKRVASASADGSARIWDAANGAPGPVLMGHRGPVTFVAFAARSAGGERVVTAGEDGTARVWDATTGKELRVLAAGGKLSRARVSPDGKRIVTAGLGDDGAAREARLWDADSGALVATIQVAANAIYEVTFSPDGSRFALAANSAEVPIHDTATGARITALVGHEAGPVMHVSYSPDGEHLVTAGFGERRLRVWNARSGALERVLDAEGDPIAWAGYRPDGLLIASAAFNGRLSMWDAGSGALLSRIDVPGELLFAAFAPDGRSVLISGVAKWPMLWNVSPFAGELAQLSRLIDCFGRFRVDPSGGLAAATPSVGACR